MKYILRIHPECRVVILDKLTYAGNLGTIEEELEDERVSFFKGDIGNQELVENIFMGSEIDVVVNFAAESHVDRSIEDPGIFLQTNILGTQVLLDVAKAHWKTGEDSRSYPVYKEGKKFLQVSTDEVYGDLERNIPEGSELNLEDEDLRRVLGNRERPPRTFGKEFFTEETPLNPRSPYAASKTAADMLTRSYGETYHLPVNVTRCSNNYGPYHFPEKLIPLIIKNILEGKKLPVYGDGRQVRDWLYVEDHCKGIDLVIQKGKPGEAYNIGGFNEELNINIVRQTIDIIRDMVFENGGVRDAYRDFVIIGYGECSYDLIEHVKDRLGHDARYAINPAKTVRELGFYPETPFTEGIRRTIQWYLDNQDWVNEVASGDYQKYYERIYG